MVTPLFTQTDGVAQFAVDILALALIGYGAERLIGCGRRIAAYLEPSRARDVTLRWRGRSTYMCPRTWR